MHFMIRWHRDEAGKINPIPDDGFQSFSKPAEQWIRESECEGTKLARSRICDKAVEMYKLHTGDEDLSELRYPLHVVVNYLTDYQGASGKIVVWFFFKQDNNGSTYRMYCESEDLICLYHDGYIADINQHIYVQGELISEDGKRINAKPLPITLERALQFVMPFGKHKGRKLSEITTDYLEWFVDKCSSSHPKIAELSAIILAARKGSKNDGKPLKLKTIAKDNHGKSYSVHIDSYDGHPTLKIDGLPSGWYISSIVNYKDDTIAVDLGQKWYCTNIQEIIAELKSEQRH